MTKQTKITPALIAEIRKHVLTILFDDDEMTCAAEVARALSITPRVAMKELRAMAAGGAIKEHKISHDFVGFTRVPASPAPKENPHTVKMEKHRATWYYTTINPQGGSFGSNNCGPKYEALARATYSMAPGTQYRLIVNGKDQGLHTK